MTLTKRDRPPRSKGVPLPKFSPFKVGARQIHIVSRRDDLRDGSRGVRAKRCNDAHKYARYLFAVGDPLVKPPALVKPVASGPLGTCPDDDDALPPHKRQKRRPEET